MERLHDTLIATVVVEVDPFLVFVEQNSGTIVDISRAFGASRYVTLEDVLGIGIDVLVTVHLCEIDLATVAVLFGDPTHFLGGFGPVLSELELTSCLFLVDIENLKNADIIRLSRIL